MSSKDYFSEVAVDYGRYRPRYPKELFEYLASTTARRERAWDCATGNGQAALGLAAHFDQIIATDLSEKQLSNAVRHERINYLISPAENVDIESDSIDLITVAQALHWLDFDGFYKEAHRVLRRDGVIAVWAYKFVHVSPSIDSVLEEFHDKTVKPYWRPENSLVDEKFYSLPFPFEEIAPPQFDIEAAWNLDHLIGFLGTWSAVQTFKEVNGSDPVELITEDLKRMWGDPALEKRVTWPLYLRVGRAVR
ncbi:MAG: class I SAM-dependent methyltransferase [Blastocatellia bacterium]|nr:class I SAM-dependent methyltransferase [Blastocatellia bacterium]